MGQNITTGTELTKAMKKLRLTGIDSEDQVKSKPTRIASTPATPIRKNNLTLRRLEDMAISAPLPISSNFTPTTPQQNENSIEHAKNYLHNSLVHDTPVLRTPVQRTEKPINTDATRAINNYITNDLSNEDIKKYLSKYHLVELTIKPLIIASDNQVTENAGHNTNHPKSQCAQKPNLTTGYSEPSLQELIRYFKEH